jgi:hypothetical protein
MDEGFLKVIWREYCAIDGFCVRLRTKLVWDKEAFDRLTEAMRRCCKSYEVLSAEQQKHLYEQARQTPQEYVAKQRAGANNDPEDDFEDLRDPPLPETTRMFPAWLAEVFWDLSHFVRDWTTHEAWDMRRAREPEYFNKAYQRLDELAFWFFTGNCPWMDEEKGWASTVVR